MSRSKAARPQLETLEARVLFSVARPDHVVVVIEEDRFSNAIGDTKDFPYLNQLAAGGLVYTNSHGVGHPSLPNYLALYAGSTLGVTDNGNTHTFTQPNLAKSLNSLQVAPGQYLSFVGFAETLPQNGDTTTRIAPDPTISGSAPDVYMRNYNPMAQFADAGTQNGVAVSNAAVNKTFASFPTTAAGFAALPNVAFVIPNTNHNTHGSNEQAPWATDPANYDMFRKNADAWLSAKMNAYAQWAKANNSILIITQDEEEDDYKIASTVSTLIVGDPRLVVPGTNSTSVNHFNVTRTIEDMFGLPLLGSTGSVGDLTLDASGRLSPFPVTVTQSASNTSLIASTASTVYGQSVTFTATVTGSGVPTGTVSFLDGSTVIGSGTVNASGVATFTTTALSGGATHSITASYGGDANSLASTSAAKSVTVSRASTTLALGASTSTTTFGQSVTLTATLSITSPGAGVASGSVSFSDGSMNLGSGTINAAGQATLAIATLGAGPHSITATYGGDTNFSGSNSSSVGVTVAQSSTTTTLSVPSSAIVGQSVTFSATVAAVAPGAGSATGTVQFYVDSVAFGSAVALSNGVATSPATTLALGGHAIVAVYSGDVNFAGSTSAQSTLNVSAAASSTTIASSANPAPVGQPITFTATVTGTGGVPSGSVQFMLDGVAFGAAVALLNGSAVSDSISTLAIGTHTVSAVYGGDANFAGSTSATLTQSVGTVNDAFANRMVLTGGVVSVIGSNIGATKEAGEPNHAANVGGASVWWTWTAPSTGTVVIDTAGSNFNTLLGVYTGTAVNALATVASNNDVVAGTLTSKVSFAITAGKVYQIAVDGFGGATGSIALNLNIIPTAPTGVSASDNTFGDKIRVTWTAPANATAYEVWRNTSNKSSSAAKISTTGVVGTTFDDTTAATAKTYYYWIKAKNAGGTSGFSAADTGIRAVAPLTNDAFANATALSGTSITVTGTNSGATKEAGEPNHGGNTGGHSVWWSWTAPAAGAVTIDTLGSTFDTLLGVYTGSAVNALTTMASNDDSLSGGTTTSKVTFTATAGTTYMIAVDGYGGVTGSITMHLSLV